MKAVFTNIHSNQERMCVIKKKGRRDEKKKRKRKRGEREPKRQVYI